MLASIPLPPAFARDRALDPLRQLAGDLAVGVLPAYYFYWKRARWWGSDGLNHAAINPALLGYFEPLFFDAQKRQGRGALHAIWAETADPPQALLVDTLKLVAETAVLSVAQTRVLAANYPNESPSLP